MSDDGYVSTRQAAKESGLHPVYIAWAAKAGKIPGAYKDGARWRIPADEFMRWRNRARRYIEFSKISKQELRVIANASVIELTRRYPRSIAWAVQTRTRARKELGLPALSSLRYLHGQRTGAVRGFWCARGHEPEAR